MGAALVRACHPGPTMVVTAVTVLLGAGVGLNGAHTVLLGVAVLAGQLSIGWSNDAIDAARDRANARSDKPTVTGRVRVRTLWWAAGVAAAGSVVLSVPLGAGAVHLVGLGAGWAYNLGLKGTWYSAATYAVAFATLPAAAYLTLDGSPAPPWWAPTAGALLGVGAHFANALPDLTDDVATDVRGLPHRIGARRSVAAMAGALGAGVVVVSFGPTDTSPGLAALSTAAGLVLAGLAVAVSWRDPRSRTTFPIVMALAVLVVALFAAGV